MKKFLTLLTLGLAISGPSHADALNVVLVHGATMDASGWRPVYDILKGQGLAVSAVQLPHTSLADDIAATRLGAEAAGRADRFGWSQLRRRRYH